MSRGRGRPSGRLMLFAFPKRVCRELAVGIPRAARIPFCPASLSKHIFRKRICLRVLSSSWGLCSGRAAPASAPHQRGMGWGCPVPSCKRFLLSQSMCLCRTVPRKCPRAGVSSGTACTAHKLHTELRAGTCAACEGSFPAVREQEGWDVRQ